MKQIDYRPFFIAMAIAMLGMFGCLIAIKNELHVINDDECRKAYNQGYEDGAMNLMHSRGMK